jgi:hypothetical protein
MVADLARTACRVVELLPESDPPHGFDERVLAALGQPAIRPRARTSSTSRQRIPVAAAVLAAALLAGGGVSASADAGRQAPIGPTRSEAVQPVADLMEAPLISERQQIGTAFISPRSPALIFVAISEDGYRPVAPGLGPQTDATVMCELVRRDGTTIALGSFPLHNGHAAWATHTSVDPHSLAGATLMTQHGHTVGSAYFTPSTVEASSAALSAGQSRTEESHEDRHSDDHDSDDRDAKDDRHHREDTRPSQERPGRAKVRTN